MILHVDPDEGSRSSLRDSLNGEGLNARSVSSYREAMEVVEGAERLDQLVTEYEIGEGTGLDLIRAVKETHPETTVILYTETDLDDIETEGFEEIVAEYVQKGGDAAMDYLLEIVSYESTHRSQVSYPRPENERDRLDILSEYPTESGELRIALDRLTELASAFFEVDIAFSGVVEESEEVFIACHNASYDRLDREDTICTFTILEDDLTVVEDIREDPRFTLDELYAGNELRFYAGAPLIAPEGEAIGSFCLMDTTPRTFSEEDRRHLELFAAEAMDQFELRRQLAREPAGDLHVQ